MDIDPSQSQSLKQKAQDLQELTSGPLSSSISRLFGSSRALPAEKDFHFFYNFDEFKLPVNEIAAESQSMLETIGSSSHIWGKPMALPEDLEDAYDWLVNVNDEVFERFDMSVDEFRKVRKKEEETGRTASGATEDLENGFQMVYGKKKKLANHSVSHLAEKDAGQDSVVKVASRDDKAKDAKPKVPFHIPSIARPQDQFNILVNNSNRPFEHVWLEKSEDGSSFIHPLEKLSVLDFVDRNIGELEPINPPPVECTLFKFVQEVKDLKDLAAKLRSVDEFAVDLEHNHYRSFQGLTCLMQISTRNEDFVVDTLKLRIHIGPYLREVFKDPAKKKVMHGADRDIVWLQRDFGIYVCNLFDTGQASRVLKLERNSLEYLLHHFCGVTANKEYQNGDWRLRPLPLEMLRYAREDTHYLLHMYDLLRIRLVETSTLELGNPDDLLVEVYKRSYDVCMQLYEKELLTDSSYLYVYGLQGADFNAQQLSVVAGLYEWRDTVARAEDESTGYILPNKTLIEIAKQMPVTVSGLRRLIKSKHSYIGHNIGSVVSIIRHSIKNAAAFEAVAEQLKQGHLKTASQEAAAADESEPLSPHQAPTSMGDEDAAAEIVIIDSLEDGNVTVQQTTVSLCIQEQPLEVGFPTTKLHRDGQGVDENKKGKNEFYAFGPGIQGESLSISGQMRDTNADTSVLQSTKVAGATVQVLKKPNRAFGALLGKSVSKKNSDMDKKDKDATKLEQIKSSMNLPFHSFAGKDETPKPFLEEHSEVSRVVCPDYPITFPAASSGNLEEIIMLEENLDGHQSVNGDLECVNERSEYREDNSAGLVVLDISDSDEPMSLSDLSSSFKECFQSAHQTSKARQAEKSKKSVPILHFKPFDYDAARKQVKFGGGSGKESEAGGSDNPRTSHESAGKKKKSVTNRIQKDDGTGDFPQGKRRQAFPATGNRSATFR